MPDYNATSFIGGRDDDIHTRTHIHSHRGGVLVLNDYSDCLRNRSKRVRTPVALLNSLSSKYP